MNTKTLRKLSNSIPGLLELNIDINNIYDRTDREIVILSASYLEVVLESALICHFSDVARSKQKESFQGNGFLSTFSSKIKLAYFMGIIDNSAYLDLEIIREIRNAFAHSIQPLSFDTNLVSKKCENLHLAGDKTHYFKKAMGDLIVAESSDDLWVSIKGERVNLKDYLILKDAKDNVACWVPLKGGAPTDSIYKKSFVGSVHTLWAYLFYKGASDIANRTN